MIGLRNVYPFTLGANIGTTITALLAATAITGATHAIAHQIAIAHFLYNLLGVIVIYGIPWLREIPIAGAEWIARLGSERKWLAIIYISVHFSAFRERSCLPVHGCPERRMQERDADRRRR